MASLSEEVTMELEVLESIFGEDYSFAEQGPIIRIRPYNFDNLDENHVGVEMKVSYGLSYPETIPDDISISSLKGLKLEQCEEIKDIALKKANENIGSTCIYDIVEVIREHLKANNVKEIVSMRDHIQAQFEADEKIRLEKEEEERIAREEAEAHDSDSDDDFEDPDNISTIVIPPNTLVTNESFIDWNAKFMKEQNERRLRILAERKEVDINMKLPSGKQIFLNNASNSVLDVGDDESLTIVEAVTAISIDESNNSKQEDIVWENEGFEGNDDIDLDAIMNDDISLELEVKNDSEVKEDTVETSSQVENGKIDNEKVVEKIDKNEKVEKSKSEKNINKEKKVKDDKKKDKKKKPVKNDDFGFGDFGGFGDFLGDMQISNVKKEKTEKKGKK